MKQIALAALSSADAVLPLRVRHRQEMNCQIVHDSLHTRDRWTLTYLCTLGASVAGFGGVAIGGPWRDKPTIYEFYVLPEHRGRSFDLFEALLAASGARLMEIQSNDLLLAVMLHTYARDIWSEKIVFRDAITTALPANGAAVRRVTSEKETQCAIAERAGNTECVLQLGNETVGSGGLMFHYNVPYADVYMDVAEPYRRRGFGSYLVQELKRLAYELGSIPAARCDLSNIASRKTLQKAGLVPYAHMVNGSIRTE